MIIKNLVSYELSLRIFFKVLEHVQNILYIFHHMYLQNFYIFRILIEY